MCAFFASRRPYTTVVFTKAHDLLYPTTAPVFQIALILIILVNDGDSTSLHSIVQSKYSEKLSALMKIYIFLAPAFLVSML